MIYDEKKKLIIRKEDKETVIADKVKVADNFICRFKGLMFQKSMPERSAIVIEPCNSIHMFCMKFAIDVIYVDKNKKITKVIRGLKPLRLSSDRKAYKTIELPSNTLAQSDEELIGSTVLIVEEMV